MRNYTGDGNAADAAYIAKAWGLDPFGYAHSENSHTRRRARKFFARCARRAERRALLVDTQEQVLEYQLSWYDLLDELPEEEKIGVWSIS